MWEHGDMRKHVPNNMQPEPLVLPAGIKACSGIAIETPGRRHIESPHPVLRVGYSLGVWSWDKIDLLNARSLPERCYVFVNDYDHTVKPRPDIDKRILRHFGVPDFVGNNTVCSHMYGYFGCKETNDQDGDLKSYSSWFRTSIHIMEWIPDSSFASSRYEFTFFTRWDSPRHYRILCLGADIRSALLPHLQKSLEISPPNPTNPYAVHIPIIERLVRLHADSVASIYRTIRGIHGSMTRSFEQIEQVSGYVANTSGNLAATLETLEKIQEQQRLIHGRLRANRVERTSLELDQDYLDFQIQVIRHLVRRSNSFQTDIRTRATRVRISVVLIFPSLRPGIL
ncbi:hypothetical protein FQN55_002172 [Onygenales sp. PD_40]|nr:hypothetical protein FQN55_002172 [Onygenales sp. PD_40]